MPQERIAPRTVLALVVATYGLPAHGLFAMTWTEAVFLWHEIPRVRAWRGFNEAQSVALGIGLAFDGKDRATARHLTKMEEDALRG